MVKMKFNTHITDEINTSIVFTSWSSCIYVQSLYTPRRYKGGADVQLHSFLTSALDGGKDPASQPGQFSSGERASDIQ